jgi:hypothetical protein
MFNLYEFQKRVRLEEDALITKMHEERTQQSLKSNLYQNLFVSEKNGELAKNYKTRVAQFIKQVRFQCLKPIR